MVEKRNDFTQNFLPPIFCFERPFEKLFSLSANIIPTYTHIYRNICKQFVKDYDSAWVFYTSILYLTLIFVILINLSINTDSINQMLYFLYMYFQ